MAVCQYRVREFDKAAEQLRRVVQDQKFAQRDEALAVLSAMGGAAAIEETW